MEAHDRDGQVGGQAAQRRRLRPRGVAAEQRRVLDELLGELSAQAAVQVLHLLQAGACYLI